jgi:hypothetical protein
MIRAQDCIVYFGNPQSHEKHFMVMWDVPSELEIGVIPKRLYCNKVMVEPLTRAFKNLIETGHVSELKTWDGCFNIRNVRGRTSPSLHSWGVAIDVNAAWNGLGKAPTLTSGFIKCFTDAGFDWGGLWGRPDGMHFQLAKLP